MGYDTAALCTNVVWTERTSDSFREEGYPRRNMVTSKKWRGQPVFGEQSEKSVLRGRREGDAGPVSSTLALYP